MTPIDRRRWIAAALTAAVAARGAFAQPAAGAPRIGVLSFGSPPGGTQPDPNIGFVDGLRELGRVEGRDLFIEWRHADNRPGRLAELAADLVRRNVALIVAGGPACIAAARAATTRIPIVAIGGSDPIVEGWAQSLARPGGNVTGLTVTLPELSSKQLAVLKQAVPGLVRVAVLLAPAELPAAYRDDMLRAAQALGLELQWLEVATPADFEPAIMQARRDGAHALYAFATNAIVANRQAAADLARRERLPSISDFPLMAQAGFLLTYGADLGALARRAAYYVDRILKGAAPCELPIERPTRLELVVNLRTAREIGITLPALTLQLADRVIE